MTVENIERGRLLLLEKYPAGGSRNGLREIFSQELQNILQFNGQLNEDHIGYDFELHRISNIEPSLITDVKVMTYLRDFILFRIEAIAGRIFPDSSEDQKLLYEYLTFNITGNAISDRQHFIQSGPDPRTLIPNFYSPVRKIDNPTIISQPELQQEFPIDEENEIQQTMQTEKDEQESDEIEEPKTKSRVVPWYQRLADSIFGFFSQVMKTFKKWLLRLKN